MELKVRFIYEALAQWTRDGARPFQTPASIDPSAFHAGDLFSLQEFGDRWLIIRARHWELSPPTLTLYVDLLPGNQSDTNLPLNVVPLR